ncbi:MAG: PAS domain S-box protein [Balneolaceae bacterium]
MSRNNTTDFSFFTDECMLLYDAHSRVILDSNPAAEELYGYTADELAKLKITDLGKRLHQTTYDVPESVTHPAYELWLHQTKAGRTFPVQISTKRFTYRGRTVKLAIIHQVHRELEASPFVRHSLPRINPIDVHIPIGFVEWDADFNVVDWSPRAEQIFRLERHKVIGKNLFDLNFLSTNSAAEATKLFDSVLESGDVYFEVESPHTIPGNNVIYCRWHNALTYNANHELIGVQSVVQDITEEKRKQNLLKYSEMRFRVIAESSYVGIYLLQNYSINYVNPRLQELTGYSEQELLHEINPVELLHPEDHTKYQRTLEMWSEGKLRSFDLMLKMVTKRGDLLHIKTYGSTIELNGKRAVIGVIIDQTSEVRAKNRIQEAVDSYRTLFDSIDDSIYILDESHTFIEVNYGAEKMYGYPKSSFIGKSPEFTGAPGKVDLEETTRLISRAMNGEHIEFMWWGQRANGEVFPKQLKLGPGRYFGKDVVIATGRDVSDQYEKEMNLRKSEELFRQLFQNSPLAITVLDEHGDVMMINESFTNLFGYSEAEIKGLHLDSLIAPKDKMMEALKLSEKSESFSKQTQRKTRSGKLIDVLVHGTPVYLENRTIAIFGIYTDITKRIEAETKVRNSLQEKEVLLSEIHHRVKNNLAVITGLLELQTQHLKSEEAVSALRDSQMRITSMAIIHEKIYQNENLSQVDFEQYLEDVIAGIQQLYRDNSQNVTIQIDSEPVPIPLTDAVPCALITNEIITNAFKHAFKGVDDPLIRISLVVKDHQVILRISDNGIGLPAPFDELETNSLGVTLIKILSRQIEGELKVETGETGTHFEVVFPLQE